MLKVVSMASMASMARVSLWSHGAPEFTVIFCVGHLLQHQVDLI